MKRPTTLAVAVVIVFAAAVAATSHTSAWVPTRRGVADPVALLTIVGIAFLGCLIGAGVLAAVLGNDPKQVWIDWLPGIVVATVSVSLFAISRVELQPERAASGVEVEAPPGREGVRLESDWRGPAVRRAGEEQAGPEAGQPASWRAEAFRRLVLILGAVSLALLMFFRRSGRGPEATAISSAADEATRSAAHGAVVGSIAAMLADPDPRTAIIGAYARLQEDLEAIEASRKEHEGPTEHLHRVLSLLEVRAAPLKKLIGLFEVARFSTHSLMVADREEALAALREVAADLATPAVASAGYGSVG